MLKQLVIPFFVLSLAAVGCGSSSSGGGAGTNGGAGHGTAGTSGGAGTSAAGTSGGAGTSAAGTSGGAGTSAAGTSGGAGTSAAGTSGGAGTSAPDASTDGPADMSTDTTAPIDSSADTSTTAPVCSTTADPGAAATPKLSASDFCHLLLTTAGCMGVDGVTIPTTYATESACETAYAASTKQACQSYHLCGNSYNKPTASKQTHCPHATGAGPCAP